MKNDDSGMSAVVSVTDTLGVLVRTYPKLTNARYILCQILDIALIKVGRGERL